MFTIKFNYYIVTTKEFILYLLIKEILELKKENIVQLFIKKNLKLSDNLVNYLKKKLAISGEKKITNISKNKKVSTITINLLKK